MKLKITAAILTTLGFFLYIIGFLKITGAETPKENINTYLIVSSIGSMMMFIGIGLFLSKLFKN